MDQLLEQVKVQGDEQNHRHDPDDGNIKVQRIIIPPQEVLGGHKEISAEIKRVCGPVILEVDGAIFLNHASIVLNIPVFGKSVFNPFPHRLIGVSMPHLVHP